MKKITLIFSFIFILINALICQPLEKADYQRAKSYLWTNLNEKSIFNLHTEVSWSEDLKWVGYYKYVEGHKMYFLINLQNFKTINLFDQEKQKPI
ncbi:MAG: hypothetical protein OEW75_04545 [Cyclobacteriaceae bacterium]|nr:hypothetical protein [Cyclobacteriaceae bacterium]